MTPVGRASGARSCGGRGGGIWNAHVGNDIGQEHGRFVSASGEKAVAAGAEASGQAAELTEAGRSSPKPLHFSRQHHQLRLRIGDDVSGLRREAKANEIVVRGRRTAGAQGWVALHVHLQRMSVNGKRDQHFFPPAKSILLCGRAVNFTRVE